MEKSINLCKEWLGRVSATATGSTFTSVAKNIIEPGQYRQKLNECRLFGPSSPFLYLIYIQICFIGIVPTKAITGTIPGNEEGVSGPGRLIFINTVSVLHFNIMKQSYDCYLLTILNCFLFPMSQPWV